VAGVRQISLGVLQKLEESTLRVLEDRPDGNSFPPEPRRGDGYRQAFSGHAFGRQVGQAGVDDLASRQTQCFEARRTEASADPARGRGTSGYPPSGRRRRG
jgi:hypothetical protein